MDAHADVGDELIEWFEDVSGVGRPSVGARALVLPVASGWGRSTVLSSFASEIGSGDHGVVFALSGGDAPDGLVLQAVWLRSELERAVSHDNIRTVLGDTPAAIFQRGLGAADAAGLLGGRAGSIAAFLVSLGVDALGAREKSQDRRTLADVRRLAARIATFSADRVPIVVVLDDAEQFESQLLDDFVTGLIEPVKSQVFVVVACERHHPNSRMLLRSDRFGLAAERIDRMNVDGEMDFDRRLELVQRLVAGWSPAAMERLADRTADFSQVFQAVGLPGAEDVAGSVAPVELVNALADAVAPSAAVSIGATVVGWLGGSVHQNMYDALPSIVGPFDDPDVRRSGQLVRPTGKHNPEGVTGAVDLMLPSSTRRRIAEVVLSSAALRSGIDDPVERIALLQPIWVLVARGDLPFNDQIVSALTDLAVTRDRIGDTTQAREIAERVAEQLVLDGQPIGAAILGVLDRTGSGATADLPAGALLGVEARVSYTTALLRTPGQSAAALSMVEQITAELDSLPPSPEVHHWRLLLGYRLVRSGHPTVATNLLTPLFALPDGDTDRRNAERVMHSAGDSGDLLLERSGFEERYQELTARSPIDEQVAIVDALANLSSRLGDWRAALHYGTQLLHLRQEILGRDHLVVLVNRNQIASWTGRSGDYREALRLFTELLDDQRRVLGPDHPEVLTTRANIGLWTGECGDYREARRRVLTEVLQDRSRVLGPDHPDLLTTRNNIASFTGECGDYREALRLSTELLDDQRRVLGPDHPAVLRTRHNIATWTERSGDHREALRLSTELLDDQRRVLGPDHPAVLSTRKNIASNTGMCGDYREALRLSTELLDDQRRVLGPDHPDVLSTRGSVASWTHELGDYREALRRSTELLGDQRRVLGPDHPAVLRTRNNIASSTGQCGDYREALRLLTELLDDQRRVLGPDHPAVLRTRNNIASWTHELGDYREALRLSTELFDDQRRVLGPDHPAVLSTRSNIASGTGQCGDYREALRLLTELLDDQRPVLGPDHPDVLSTRSNIAFWTHRSGDYREALRLLTELLDDQRRVLGPDHPASLATQNSIAVVTGQIDDDRDS